MVDLDNTSSKDSAINKFTKETSDTPGFQFSLQTHVFL
jgi:hypothetical protein